MAASYELCEVAPGALPRGAVAGLVRASGSVTLELPGRGRVRVAGDHVVVEAVSSSAGAALHAELHTWIRGQQWRQAGLLVFGGACVEADGRAVVLAARPRDGASFAALGLVRAGWRLLSDGVSAVRETDAGFVAVPGRSAIELDAHVVAPGSAVPARVTGTGAPRVLVDVPHSTTEAPVSAVVILVARRNLQHVSVAAVDEDTAAARLATTAVRDLARPDRPHEDLAGLVARVPVTTLLLPVRASTPQVLAEAVLGVLEPVGVG